MQFSDFAFPTFIAFILFCGLYKRLPVFDVFLEGAKGGLSTILAISPSVIGLVTATTMLRASGFFDLAASLLSPLTEAIGFPAEVLPLALLKPVSGGAASAVLHDLLHTVGPDSFAGKVACVIAGSTETTFYTLTVYFAVTAVQNSRHTLSCALLADCTGILLGMVFVRLLL